MIIADIILNSSWTFSDERRTRSCSRSDQISQSGEENSQGQTSVLSTEYRGNPSPGNYPDHHSLADSLKYAVHCLHNEITLDTVKLPSGVID